jgi:4-hydroxythreonine-4-phosphate dehydrogenase
MGPLIVIVADDLTGAADCGAAWAAAGLSTVVTWGEASRARDLPAEVIAFNAATRAQPPDAARRATELAVRDLCSPGGVRILYKKIDSTLRGNFPAEIAAARDAFAERAAIGDTGGGKASVPPLVIVAPAFPATGRTTRGGHMFLHGVPLEKSEVWRAEEMGGSANLPVRLRAGGGLRTEVVGLEAIRGDPDTLTAILTDHAGSGIEAIVCDAESDDDLSAVARGAARLRRPVVFAGSAGLALHLPRAFGLARTHETPAELDPGRPAAGIPDFGGLEADHPIASRVTAKRAPLLFVIGSISSVSRSQLLSLSAEPGMGTLTLPPGVLRGGPDSPEWRESARLLHETLDGNDDVAVALGTDGTINLDESASLSRALAQFLLPAASRIGGLFCTGGATAEALLTAAGAAGIRLIGEVEPGVPLGTVEQWRDLPIVTKAGAFGSPQTLVRCRRVLHRWSARKIRGQGPLSL